MDELCCWTVLVCPACTRFMGRSTASHGLKFLRLVRRLNLTFFITFLEPLTQALDVVFAAPALTQHPSAPEVAHSTLRLLSAPDCHLYSCPAVAILQCDCSGLTPHQRTTSRSLLRPFIELCFSLRQTALDKPLYNGLDETRRSGQ